MNFIVLFNESVYVYSKIGVFVLACFPNLSIKEPHDMVIGTK